MLRVFLPKGKTAGLPKDSVTVARLYYFWGCPADKELPGENRRKGKGAEERLHTGFRPSSGCRFVFIRHEADTRLVRGGEEHA